MVMPVAKLKLSFSQVTRSVTLKNKNKYTHASGCRLPQLRIKADRQILLIAPPPPEGYKSTKQNWVGTRGESVSEHIDKSVFQDSEQI